MKRNKRLILMAILIWIMVGLYGVFFNITYIDEAKYLIKGWLMATGKVGYYSTKEFFYQHMPGGLLWYGWGQKLFGPSLLVARIQSFVLGIIIILFSYLTSKRLFNKKAGRVTTLLFTLLPILSLYYASAVPQSLAALTLVLTFYFLVKRNYLAGSFWVTMSFVVRENFLFTLGIYILWLIKQLRLNKKLLAGNLLLIALTLAIFILPGYPGINGAWKNFPGLTWLMPVSQAEKEILNLHWIKSLRTFDVYLKAVREFGVIYFAFMVALAYSIFMMLKNKSLVIVKEKQKHIFKLLILVFWFNLAAHTWSAFKTSPRSVVSYFAYIAPLGIVALSGFMAKYLSSKKILTSFWLLLILSPLGIISSSLYQPINKESTIVKVNRAQKNIKKLFKAEEKIIWIAEPMSLFLAEKVNYYPLINHTNIFKPSDDTKTVRTLGFWNRELMQEWLLEADLMVIDPNRLELLRGTESSIPFAEWLSEELNEKWDTKDIDEYIWPEGLRIYTRKI